MIEDQLIKESIIKIMSGIRQYPYAQLSIGARAALAFYEILQALILLEAENPILTAALITLPHRVKSDSVIDHEQIIKEIVESSHSFDRAWKKDITTHIPSSIITKILRELDNLQDVVYAMPYEIDILDRHWFKVSQESLFSAEAPTLLSLTIKEGKKADFKVYQDILRYLQNKELIQIKSDSVKLTRLGSFVKYTNISNYIEKHYPNLFKDQSSMYPSGNIRKYRRGDSFKNLHVRRTLRSLVRHKKNSNHASKENLRIKEISIKRNCLIVLALDHSWSMARSRKLQYAKDAVTGLILAARKNLDQTALIAFSDRAIVISSPTNEYGLLIEKLTELRPENETNIADTLVKSRMIFLSGSRKDLQHLIIVTDGVPTSNNQDLTRKDLEAKIIYELRKIGKMGVTISVFCIRDELEESDTSLAKQIATIGKGSFHLVTTNDLLNRILQDYSMIKS